MTTFIQNRTDSEVTLTIGGRRGSFDGMPTERTWVVRFLGTPATFVREGITVGGEPLDDASVEYDEETGTLTLTISTDNLAAPITINVPLSQIA